LCRPCLLGLRPPLPSAQEATRLWRALGKDGLDSSPGYTLSAQKLVHRDRLTREPTGGQVLGNRAQHRRTLDGLALNFGDFGPKAGRKLCGDCASPPIGQAAAIEVPNREQRRRAGNEPADSPRTDRSLATGRQAIGGCFHAVSDLRQQCRFTPWYRSSVGHDTPIATKMHCVCWCSGVHTCVDAALHKRMDKPGRGNNRPARVPDRTPPGPYLGTRELF
jgi:hypothetical protein